MSASHLARHAEGCLCCGTTNLVAEHTVVSPYLARKAFDDGPTPCRIFRCNNCDFRFYDRGLSEDEGNAYYQRYRDENYFRERNRFEPFYTHAVHDGLTDLMGSPIRRLDFNNAIAAAGLRDSFGCAIDYGGGDGTLISEIWASRRISFDPSGNPGRNGVEVIGDRVTLPRNVDLVTCAQVLEHVSDPSAIVDDMISLLRPGGLLYLEVPDQIWRRLTRLSLSRGVTEWLCAHPRWMLAADIYSTAFRVKLGFLPPFGFVPMREHINFFSATSLRSIALRDGLRLKAEGRTGDRSFYLIAERL